MKRIAGLVVAVSFVVLAPRSAAHPQTVAQAQAPESNADFRAGITAFKLGNYAAAIPRLSAALTELKTQPGFETSVWWRVLVDTLGMAYGLSGDLKKATETFEYGVSKDPNYPLFHYNLACAAAEANDLDTAIPLLRKAFSLSAYGIPGEAMPDPATDASFKRFLKDEKFKALLAEIEKAAPKSGKIETTLPGAPWTFTVPAGDFKVEQQRMSPNGRQAYVLVKDPKTNLNASWYIEPADKCADSRSCRDMVQKDDVGRIPGAEKIVTSQIGGASVFEFFLPAIEGVPVRLQNMYAEFVVDGYWVDLHMSKALYEPSDHALFESFIKSVTFAKKAPKTGALPAN